MSGDDQLDLFGTGPDAPREVERVGLSPAAAELSVYARRLPPELRMGTSSWSFPGWAGLVWDREARKEVLARHGLSAYARHPLFRTVGIDRSYYGPPRADEFARYAAAVPEDFRFLVKAHEWLTMVRFPRHPRFGEHSGGENPYFLDPVYAAEEVIGPAVAGLGDRLGVILLQFPPQDLEVISARGRFPARLERFLSGLPTGPTYAVEIRNHQLFTPRYLATLRAFGAVHCLNAHPSMHELSHQIRHVQPLQDPAIVIRWMLARHFRYDEAKQSYAPFDCLVDPDEQTRSAIAELCREAAAVHTPVNIVVNNKAEGSAPLSIVQLARAIAD
jgi:uncharacterized protein YecE (DUF72 family)